MRGWSVKRFGRIGAVLVCCLGFLGIVLPSPLAAHGLLNTDERWRPDSWTREYCFGNVPAADAGLYHSAMASLDSTTSMTVVGTGCTATTDIAWFQQDIAEAGVRGVSWCVDGSLVVAQWTPLVRRCGQFWSVVDVPEIAAQSVAANLGADTLPNIATNWHKTIRHELGHTAGLNHFNDPAWQAMVSGRCATSLVFLDWRDDHKNHINAAEVFWP